MPSKRPALSRLSFLIATLLAASAPGADAAPAKAKAKKGKPAASAPASTACIDFYSQVDGPWMLAHPAPPTGSVSAFDAMRTTAREQERALLDEMARAPRNDADRALGMLWSDGMNEAAIEAAGATPLQPLFARIAQVKKPRDVAAAIADLHAAGVPVLFHFSADVDLKDFDRQLGYANQGGLGLPDPDYYTRTDEDTRALLGRYRSYVATILQLSGTPPEQVDAESGWVIGIEMRLAQASLPLVQLRDPYSAYHPVTLAELDKAYPSLGFARFLAAQHASDDRLSLAHPGFFAAADGLVAGAPVEQWKAYLRFHAANALAPYLSRGFQDAHFQLYDRVLDGDQKPQERWLSVLDAVDRALGEPMGHAYAERYLPDASKAAAQRVADALRAQMKVGLEHETWMDAPTRAAALAKFEKLHIEVGEPKRTLATSVSGLSLGGSFGSDMLAAAAWSHRRDMAAIGRRTSERRWPVLAQQPDVSYDLLQNRVIVTAAFLQPPVFDANADIALQFGALGALIGHQLHYAFDSKGRTIDADGNLHDWWTALTSAAWEQRTAGIIAQYDAYPAIGAVKVNGRQTRDENLADLAGIELAWDAYRNALLATPTPKGSPTTDRAFFEAYAKVWSRSAGPDLLTAEVSSSIQAPPKYRVDGPLANLPDFGKTYACKAGQPMVAKTPVTIWR